jgi:hypothetical protein
MEEMKMTMIPSSELQERIRELQTVGGTVARYPAIVSVHHRALDDAHIPTLLNGHSDLKYLVARYLEYDGSEISNAPVQVGVYHVTIQVDWTLCYRGQERLPYHDMWDFRIEDAILAMPLDIPQNTHPNKQSAEPGFSQQDLGILRSYVNDYKRISGIVNPHDVLDQNQFARILRIIDNLLPPECHICGKEMYKAVDIKKGMHVWCAEQMFGVEETRG